MTSLIHKLRWVYIRNNFQSFSFTIFYIITTISLFLYRYQQYVETTRALAVARASAIAIYYHSGLIMVLILRNTISQLRSFGLARYLPLDHYVYFHKVAGWSIAFFSTLHTLAHLYNFSTLTDLTTISYVQFLISVKLGIGWFFGSACLTGWILVLILAIMLIFTMNFVRRTGNFEFFYYSHKLYVFYIIFLFLHASSTLQWMTMPLIFFVFDKISTYIRVKKDHHGQTYAIEGTLLPSRVLRLVIRKPKFFHFVPGDFVYLMVPSITKYEWHPMTISSAPEDKELTLHIRAVGEWTNRLFDHFDHARTLTLKKMLEEWKFADPHQILKDTCPLTECNQKHSTNGQEPKEEDDCSKPRAGSITIMKRTMILPIPDDCDENGCGKSAQQPKKQNSFDQASSAKSSDIVEDGVSIEMQSLSSDQQNNNVPSDHESNYLTQPLMWLKNLHKDVQTNAVFLKSPLKIHLDGPYGAPSSNIFESEHAVLVATGIGVTPFASILQSIMYRHIDKTRKCPSCNHSWIERVPSRHINNLRKVDFIWINRNQNSFEWFVELLSDLAKQQCSISAIDDRFFDIHMYITSNQQSSVETPNRINAKSVADLYKDAINWRFGRPEWEQIFQNIRNQQRGKVTVFYCGRPDLSGYLRQKCSEFDFFFKKEVF